MTARAGATGLVLLLVASAPAQGQGFGFTVGAMGAAAFRDTRQDPEVATERLSGVTLGLQGSVTRGRWFVDMRYLEGNLSPSVGTVARDVVEGELQLGFRARDWLDVKFGPHIRSYLAGEDTERWVFWEVRGRAEGGLFTPRSERFALRSYVEAWLVLSGDVNLPNPYGSGRGAETGIVVRFAQTPVWGRFAYRVDRGNLRDGARSETLEEIVLAIGITR